MIRHTFVIWEHDWIVRAYFAVNGYWADEILGHLQRIGADMDVMRSAAKNLRSGHLNTGLTYTSPWNGRRSWSWRELQAARNSSTACCTK